MDGQASDLSEVLHSNVNSYSASDWSCSTAVSLLQVLLLKEARQSHQEGGPQMLTIEGLVAVISLVLTAFGLGYAIGRNSKNTRE